MATKPEEEELQLDDQVEGEEIDDAEEPDEPEGDGDETDEDEEVPSFGNDVTDARPDDSSLIKSLREEIRKRDRELSEARKAVPAAKPIEVGEKPTLSGCEYDEERYETELDAWKQRKSASENAETEAAQRQQKDAEAWQAEVKRYHDGKAALPFADVQEAEETVVAALDDVQQAVLVKVAENPAKLLYALSKHPDKLTELAQTHDPLKAAAMIARLEGQLKMVKRRRTPEPETVERGSGATVRSGDKQLAKLEAEADKTGDRTKLVAYKKKLKATK